MAIRAVTFDLWNTIYDDDVGSDRVRKETRRDLIYKAFSEWGVNTARDDLNSVLNRVEKRADHEWAVNCRTVGARERIDSALSFFGFCVSPSLLGVLVDQVEDVTAGIPPRPFSGADKVLGFLAERHPLGLISDTGVTPGRVLRNVLQRDGLLKYFSALTFSDEIGVSKPHERAFRSTLDALKVSPGETVHVGDKEMTDIHGALRCGMKVLHISRKVSDKHCFNKDYFRANDLDGILSLFDRI